MCEVDLICVDNTDYEGFLTLNKWYKGKVGHTNLPTLNIDHYFYYDVSNDRLGTKDTYNKHVFMTKQEWRDKLLDELCVK